MHHVRIANKSLIFIMIFGTACVMPACLVLLRKRESICLSDINVKFAITNSKPKHSSDYTFLVSFNTATQHSSVKYATNHRRMKNHLRNTCIRSTIYKPVSAVMQNLQAKKIQTCTLEPNIEHSSVLFLYNFVPCSCYHNGLNDRDSI